MLAEKIKNNSILIKELIEKDNNLKFYNYIEKIVISTSPVLSIITAIFVISSMRINDIIIKIIFGSMCFLVGLFGFGILLAFLLLSINYIIKGKIIKKDEEGNSKFLSLDYITTRSKFLDFKNSYDKLSKIEKNVFSSLRKKEVTIEEIESCYLEKKVEEMLIKDFIDYYKNGFESDSKKLKINRDEVINKKILEILEYLDYTKFNKFKDSLIEITLTLKDKTKQLNIINKFEEIKKQYDEETINIEIANKLNKINGKPLESKLEKNNKVLKSI